jgi:ADP-heptose:LPS heptosyltransferase
MHMAAASGVPTLGLFGPSDERLYAPWSAAAVTVRGPRSYEDIRRDDPALSKPICHMMDLDVSTVLRAACSLLDASASVESVSDA